MKLYKLVFFLAGCVILPPVLIADNYPQDYIDTQLEAVRKPVKVNLKNIKPGQLVSVQYVNMPVWIYRRTANDLAYLAKIDKSLLADPENKNLRSSIEAAYGSSASYVWARLLLSELPAIEKSKHLSKNNEYFVVGGWSPHSGCALTYLPQKSRSNIGVAFHDTCSGAFFDVAGMVVKAELTGNAIGTSASFNLYIPPHEFKNKTTLLVGLRSSIVLPEIHISNERRYMGKSPTEKLITAAKYNDIEMVRMALNEGANANFFAIRKGGPFDAAIIGGSTEIIELLIANGAKPSPNSFNVAGFVDRPEVIELINRMK
ncbi:hypothetical protein [Glaciecola petra]|uniref:Ankyrin repeat domain-containing protein n=1 Tax=Glaciecola petra TaxID=3075602 RepID=A0ABU2ZNC6_9ALTE|nr:hypothetical protein [Aestuariibacter sp. P117]MDT0593543.1 hypothetical protein [Aestuariibacter sp. P117]